MIDLVKAIFTGIGAFILIYAATHGGELPELFPRAAKDAADA